MIIIHKSLHDALGQSSLNKTPGDVYVSVHVLEVGTRHNIIIHTSWSLYLWWLHRQGPRSASVLTLHPLPLLATLGLIQWLQHLFCTTLYLLFPRRDGLEPFFWWEFWGQGVGKWSSQYTQGQADICRCRSPWLLIISGLSKNFARAFSWI